MQVQSYASSAKLPALSGACMRRLGISAMATPKAPGAGLRLLDLDDGVLAQVVDKLGIARRTAMLGERLWCAPCKDSWRA